MPVFTPSLELNAAFYAEVIEPIVRPFDHQAALLGWGSDVLGYDTERSTDHGWGPRLQIFLDQSDVDEARTRIEDTLPDSFRGWSTRYVGPEPEPVHHVTVTTLGEWLTGHLGIDPRKDLRSKDWLTIPQQQLLGVVGGAVYHDPTGDLAEVRRTLAYFPDDVWRWLLACQWRRVAQEEHLIGRAAQVGDELGSRVAAARMVRDLMKLAFLLEKTYWPYTKWFGTAFSGLSLADDLAPELTKVLEASSYQEREPALCLSYEKIARNHNDLGITEHLDPTTRPFFDRPFMVLEADRFTFATLETVQDEELRSLPLIGSVDQFADSTDVLSNGPTARKLAGAYA